MDFYLSAAKPPINKKLQNVCNFTLFKLIKFCNLNIFQREISLFLICQVFILKDYSETEWKVREASERDIPEMLDVFSSAYEDYPYDDEVSGLVRDNETYVLVAEIDDEVVGTASLISREDEKYEFGRAAIKPDYQGIKSGERSLFYDLIDERASEADEKGARMLLTNAVTSHGITQNVYEGEGFQPVMLRPHTTPDKMGQGVRETHIMMCNYRSDENERDEVFAATGSFGIIDTVLDNLDYERDILLDDYNGEIEFEVDRKDNNDLAQINVRPSDSGRNIHEFESELGSVIDDFQAVEVFLDANSPLASELGTRMPDEMKPSGFMPGYMEDGRDVLAFSYSDTVDGSSIERNKIAELIQSSRELMEKSGIWNDYEIRPHRKLDGVYEIYDGTRPRIKGGIV